jgi:hypothetical protein
VTEPGNRARPAVRKRNLGCDTPEVLVQIYGITTPHDAEMVNALAPDNVGVVLDEGFETWDGVSEATARTIVSELTDVTVVALSLVTERDRILQTVEVISPDILHLVRAGEGMPPDGSRYDGVLHSAPGRRLVCVHRGPFGYRWVHVRPGA